MSSSKIQRNFDMAISVLKNLGISEISVETDVDVLDEMEELYSIESPACYFVYKGVEWAMGQAIGPMNKQKDEEPRLFITCTEPAKLAEIISDQLYSDMKKLEPKIGKRIY